MAMPTALSAKATALDSQRKHDHVPPSNPQHSKNAESNRQLPVKNNAQPESQESLSSSQAAGGEAGSDDEDDESLYGDILDSCDLEPYINGRSCHQLLMR